MRKLFPSPFLRKWLLLTPVWIIGLCAVGWATPVGPRDWWKINNSSASVIGFLNDGQTLLTSDINQNQSLELYDYQTGEFRADLTRDIKDRSILDQVELIPGLDLILHIHPLRNNSNT